ncbi:tyrosine-protein phosphatase [uncultured Brevundimonas sp.]|uniref:tyrosine-protein phosphatase n=1 Tax=uncultured Brevundimonas sp. TaxID=213418 RepID=UPI0034426E06
MTPADRFLPTDSILNFRDYAGYAASDAGWVRTAHLFRSFDHSIASADDLSLVNRLGKSAIVGLRSPHERAMRPPRQSPNHAEARGPRHFQG